MIKDIVKENLCRLLAVGCVPTTVDSAGLSPAHYARKFDLWEVWESALLISGYEKDSVSLTDHNFDLKTLWPSCLYCHFCEYCSNFCSQRYIENDLDRDDVGSVDKSSIEDSDEDSEMDEDEDEGNWEEEESIVEDEEGADWEDYEEDDEENEEVLEV
jgi:hypothetical protein